MLVLKLLPIFLSISLSWALTCPQGSVTSFSNDVCWILVKSTMKFIDAEEYCRSQGGHLTSLHNAFDNLYLADITKDLFGNSNAFFIGGSNFNSKNWTWTDGSTFNFFDWAAGEPTYPEPQNCLHIEVSRGYWRSADCFVESPFVCTVPTTWTPSTMTPSGVSTPNPMKTTSGMNVPTPSASNSSKYQQAADYFTATLDTTQDPCNNFYEYVCGNKNPNIVNIGGMDLSQMEDFTDLDAGLMSQANNPLPVALIKHAYSVCKTDRNNWANITANGTLVVSVVNNFKTVSSLPFPLMDMATPNWPQPAQLGKALGYLSGAYGIDTLVSFFVDTDWMDNQGSQPYKLYMDQPVLTFPWTYYVGNTWSITQPALKSNIEGLFKSYAQIKGITLDNTQLNSDVQSIIQFEYNLANNFSTDATTRWQTKRNYNPFTNTVFGQNFTFFDVKSYFTQLTTYAPGVTNTVTNDGYTFIVMEPGQLSKLQIAINANQFPARTLLNYFYYRILDANADYFPMSFRDNFELSTVLKNKIVYRKPRHGRPSFVPKRKVSNNIELKDLTPVQEECMNDFLNYFDMASTRVFVDQIYPTSNDKQAIKTNGGRVASSIILGMRSMIDGLSWMDDSTRQKAYDKLNNLIINIAYPDFVVNDTLLVQYYNGIVDFRSETSYYKIFGYLKQFNVMNSLNLLMKTVGADRTAFNGPAAIANAWYQPELNSITLPAGFLRNPIYDPQFPWSLIFGSIGIVSGHETTHGFDSSGTQWNALGNLESWMDATVQMAFNNMTKCVINEYDMFCPLDSSQFTPNCINGQQTQGENVADNGGIHAAFRAYKNSVDFYGEDPRLPGPLMSQFTHDQIFFMSFGKILCLPYPDPQDEYVQILTDPHSPAKYRVFGTLRNYPAFRNAFNCPVGDNYTPNSHCNVWVSSVTSGSK